MERISDGYCNNSPDGQSWPVCHLVAGHSGRHESADFWWYPHGQAQVKQSSQLLWFPVVAGDLFR
jgi:hypothetical protein